jgi:hypothetical protein
MLNNRLLLCAIAVSGCGVLAASAAEAQGFTQPKQGKGGSVIQGSAGTNGSAGDKGLQHCDKPM